MRKGQKYKIWKLGDFHEIERMISRGYSYCDIANHFGITRNSLYKSIMRHNVYKKKVEREKHMKVLSLMKINKIRINNDVIDVIQKYRTLESCST